MTSISNNTILKRCVPGAMILFFLLSVYHCPAQELPVKDIEQKISTYKNDPRGPYYRIKWFCADGTIRDPKDPCPDDIGGGIQHASYKEDVKQLAEEHHIFFGEILAHADKEAFWDKGNYHSRLKQYQLGKYLSSVDDGWILRKGQYYRGAVQFEDEEDWGVEFYNWLLKEDRNIEKNYFLIRQSLRDIPHDGDTNLAQLMRSQSKVLAEDFPDFMDVRIKIHGKPDVSDIKTVRDFQKEYKDSITPERKKQFRELDETLRKFYAPTDVKKLKKQLASMTFNGSLKNNLMVFLQGFDRTSPPREIVPELADILCKIREGILDVDNSNDRLLLIDLTNEFEDILLKKTQEWKPSTVKELLEKTYSLSLAAEATGLIEQYEWKAVQPSLSQVLQKDQLSIAQLNDFLKNARSVVEWSAAMVKANYHDIVSTYSSFEPKSYGFIDDRVRSSVALDLGESVSQLGGLIAKKTALSNKVLDIEGQSSIRGLNPGYAYGELVVVQGSPEHIEVVANKIYVFQKPPSDLKPVAGIMTVSEGNLVSHVQLLARNLGIPNTALSDNNLKSLAKYNGQHVFYAVSNKGNVIVKPAARMSAAEKALFSKKERSTNMILVPVDQIRLDQTDILNMKNVDATDSGKSCGPKAANLGQLKSMFPEQVVEGLVIPFGIFKKHMQMTMPGENYSYWKFLNNIFTEAGKMRDKNINEKEVENYQLRQLELLREAIIDMPLDKDFVSQLRNRFQGVFGKRMGSVPVFLRSDTNMEDLKEFTGAGLNLTLFNIVSEEKIIEGVKQVWASPYTERSFKWRQKYLSNPENVYPSILIIPSVDVDYSGVMITKGINEGDEDDLTVAFSRGAGGAVDGQSAETHLITRTGHYLLAPARQPDYIRLPASGGTSGHSATFEQSILNDKNINDMRQIANAIRNTLPKNTEREYKGAYDVELGFKNDKLWLFQIRPFVENKKAKSSEYLMSISPKIDYGKIIRLSEKI